jgi:hypothetical protein
MVPIHDTDLAAERWAQEEWQNYELWEKVEVRLKRQKRIWVLGTALTFVILSALPIVMDRWPKWVSRVVLRHVIQQMSQIKLEAGIHRAAVRLRFLEPKKLSYQVEKIQNCQSQVPGEVLRSGNFGVASAQEEYVWVDPKLGQEMGVPGLQDQFCYDYLTGSASTVDGKGVVGFAIIPAKDLKEKRLDRMSILLLSGPSAEVSVD